MLPTVVIEGSFRVDFARILIFTFFMLFVHCILCISCICFVFVSYALTLSMSGLCFMSIKICSVLLTKTFVIC